MAYFGTPAGADEYIQERRQRELRDAFEREQQTRIEEENHRMEYERYHEGGKSNEEVTSTFWDTDLDELADLERRVGKSLDYRDVTPRPTDLERLTPSENWCRIIE